MSSGGGPRAKGSGRLDEGKFRQRVDDHYRIMADAKKNLRFAGNMQLLIAVGFFFAAIVTALILFSGPACAASAILCIMCLACGKWALAAGGNTQAEKAAAAYVSRSRVVALLMQLPVGAGFAADYLGVELPQAPVLAAMTTFWALAMTANLGAAYSAGKLLRAFEAQKKKATSKAQ